MDETPQKNCWGIAAKAVLGMAGVFLLIWLVGGSETATEVLASG